MISIIVPVYEMNRQGIRFLDANLKSIFMQSYKDYEIIISDHSKDNQIQQYIKNLNKNINYIRCREKYGLPSVNINYALDHAKGKYIKYLFQDDCFFDPLTLEILEKHTVIWSFCGRNEDGETRIPYFTQDIRIAKNTLSNPSGLMHIRNELRWDEQLIWVQDCDFYYRMYLKYGEPEIIPCALIQVGKHENQLTNLMTKTDKLKEKSLIRSMYDTGKMEC